MKKFKFFSLNSEEAIGVCDAFDEQQAIETFAAIKKLSIDKFNKLYRVTKA
jgi:hypothetical protein